MPFVKSILEKNGEKAKDFILPQEPGIEEVFADIRANASKEEITMVSQFIETYGVTKLMSPPPGKEGHEAVRIFQKSHDRLMALYKPKLLA